MPKRISNLWPKVFDFENLLVAFNDAQKGKKYNNEVLNFSHSLEENLIEIQNQLIWRTWRPSRCREFYVKEPKLRLIQAPAFKDRVVHHALDNVLKPVFEKRFIKDSYACRTNKGNHAAVKRLQFFLRKYDVKYALKADISKYFPSINHDKLLFCIFRAIKDPEVMCLCDNIVKNSGYENRGLPLGSLTSQLFANVYLDKFDHYIKDELGVKSYVRYMDDFIILSESKAFLRGLLRDIESFLTSELCLSLNPKTSISPAKQGIDFAGYRIWDTHLLPRKRIIKRTRRQFRLLQKKYAAGAIGLDYIQPRVASFLGYAKHCASQKTVREILYDFKLVKR